MGDWNLPSLAQTWANFLAALKGRDESNAKMDYSADSNIPDGTVRWSAANKRFELWNASTLTWGVLSTQYLINVDQVDSEHAADFASAVGGSGSRQAKDADTVDGVDLPGTIAQVLTDHTKAAHDALNIDAETLDGLNSSQFLRSDTGDTMSGALTVNNLLTLKDPAGSANNEQVDFTGGYALYRDDAGVGTDNSRFWLDTPSEGEIVIGPRAGAVRLDSVRIRADVLYVDNGANRIVWHEENDGAGSGLDADKLDGIHLSSIFGTVTTPARSNGVNYTNSHGRPMLVIAMRGNDAEVRITIDGVIAAKAQGNNSGDQACVAAIVPAGSVYSFTNLGTVTEIY